MRSSIIKILTLLTVLAIVSPSITWAESKLKYSTSAYSDIEGTGMNRPEGVACSGNSFVVADTGNGRLLLYSYENETLSSQATLKVSELPLPIRVQMASGGDFYVLDGKLLKIARVGADGTFKGFINLTGVPSPAQMVPRSFKVGGDSGLLYILDIFGGRVLVVNGEGAYQKHISFPPDHGFFSDLAVNYRGDVLLVDSVKGVVYSTSGGGDTFLPLAKNLKERVRFPADITTDGRGIIFVVDHHGGKLLVIGQDGSVLGEQLDFGWKESLLNYPVELCINVNENLFIADRNNSRVQIFKVTQ